MSERIESRIERRQRRSRRRTGMIGLAILVSSVGATVALLLLGQGTAPGAVTHHPPAGVHQVATSSAGAR
jgi:hypothetical protein